MPNLQIQSDSVPATLALGRQIGQAAPPHSLCIALEGTLGAGKTHFVRGLAEGAAVADPALVSSPTYVLLNVYESSPADPHSKTVYHLDAYRLTGPEDLAALGFEELLDQPGIVVVEWASRVTALLPQDRLSIHLEVEAETTRTLTVTATGPIAEKTLADLAAALGAARPLPPTKPPPERK